VLSIISNADAINDSKLMSVTSYKYKKIIFFSEVANITIENDSGVYFDLDLW